MRRNRFFLAVCCGLGLSFAVSASGAQVVRGIFVTPIPNQPMSATFEETRTTIQPNGRTFTLHRVGLLARDSGGQIYNGGSVFVPLSFKGQPPTSQAHIFDPKSRLNTFLTIPLKLIRQTIYNGPSTSVPPDFFAAPEAAAMTPSEFMKQEDLGWEKVEGLNVHGVRETQTIPGTQSGTGQEVKVVDEYWYSNDLRLNLIVKHDDPRVGNDVKTVTNIQRQEPAAAIFTVPSDYQMDTPAARQAAIAARRTPIRIDNGASVVRVPASANNSTP